MTDIDDLDIWQGSNAAPWARQAADRWALLAERVAHLFIARFALSPLPRTET